ncbi:SDR family oxidoreductase [uncultured Shewanella sp.]|uniref:SDR family oxidoreductase n=1 Tax=uncultured Shewanella sp. TaxID=173975 RepID=UPI00262E1625|nr:SDR family oxidoreductase [uncultured Shewanella sp.]
MKNMLITCATSGIGAAVATALSHDHHLFVAGRNVQKLQHLTDQLSLQAAGRVDMAPLDFFSESIIDDCAQALSQSNRLDGVVFILPRIPPSSEVFPDDESWKNLYHRYFILPLRLMKQIVENHCLNPGGKIVFISGLSSKTALSHYAMNNCLRSAWLGQAKTMALSLAELQISVNTLSLGGVMTDSYTQKMQNKAKDKGMDFDQLMEQETANIPLKKYASVDNVTQAVLSLLGPISDHMTGQNILLDGGFNKAY